MSFSYLLYFRITPEFKDRNYRTDGLFKFLYNYVKSLQKHLSIWHINLLDFIPAGPWLYFTTVLAQATRHFIIKSVLIHFIGTMCQSNTFWNCFQLKRSSSFGSGTIKRTRMRRIESYFSSAKTFNPFLLVSCA